MGIHLNLSPSAHRAISCTAANSEEFKEIRNIVHRIEALVIRILGITNRMAERDRENTNFLKNTFREVNSDIHRIHIRIGNSQPWIAGISILANSSQLFVSKDMAPMIQFVASQVPSFGNMYPTYLQAKETSLQAEQSVRLSEITSLSQKQSDAELKQLVQEFFRLVCEVERNASR